MMRWIGSFIERASWWKYLIWLILFLVYEYIVFSMPGPWAQLVTAVGNENGQPVIPDLMYGFHAGQPALAFTTLSEVINSYIRFNFIDLPYAFLGMMAAMSIMALALKRFNLRHWAFRCILIVPAIYFASEVIENVLLGSMAAKLLPIQGALVFIQQLGTTVKMTAYGFNLLVGFIALAACVIGMLVSYFRKRN